MRDEAADGRYLLTIGQLAGYAGVTIKAVRVYHDRGLLPEPPRDSSGYRRYGAEHAVQLVRIRTLAAAGVPLARIRELLAAGPEAFTAAIEEIDHNLRERAAEIERTRVQIAELRAGDTLFVSPPVAGYLAQLRAAGISERTVRLERDLWILLQSVAPQHAAAWVADKLDAIADQEFRTLYREYDAAYDWARDDPRLAAVAERTRRWYAGRETGVESGPLPDATITRLAAATAAASSPAWARIGELTQRADDNRAET
ncbi:MerR family transcriptional regulator [Actinoplanes italicus]|uniref:DNA-binding transcriptional MerR regulator n=1 Tax=Actinoplanes italicus TaxID=113567 RepID=A0A2T0KEY2_9ACTN|nr:MerR family transcriptional regulator [Actinoplanes italicus]PRX21939.1 DNA-binding transcriptional MerR regulator [Actinoplanes italicus]GIE29644.1 MerR family transcriptional regulator [Actinoplanes italicus]